MHDTPPNDDLQYQQSCILPYYQDATGTIYQGNVIDVLRGLPDESVQCVVTSPPYWGLRDYGIEPQILDGEPGCEHEWGESLVTKQSGGGWAKEDSVYDGGAKKKEFDLGEKSQGSFCLRCGAWRGSLGLEPTPELFVSHIVQVFREIRRVLRKDGVLFLNLGDSYAREGGNTKGVSRHWDGRESDPGGQHDKRPNAHLIGLKPKDLCGIPWRVAFALQADGWYLRSDIIWSKPNPMPESVTDRPTKSHEYIFLLTKSAKYFWDQEGVREPQIEPFRLQGSIGTKRDGFREDKGGTAKPGYNPSGRNIRSVWTLATQPFPSAHFATFCEAIPERCIKAGSKPGDTILDPFGGAGTVGLVAEKLNRKWILIELNPEYCQMARDRILKKAWNVEEGQSNWIQEGLFA